MEYYTSQDIDEFWSDIWQESIKDSYSLSIGNTTSNATLTGYIDSDYLALAVAAILGYSICIENDDRRELFRIAPACHPRVRNLYASSVRISPYALMEAYTEEGGEEEEEDVGDGEGIDMYLSPLKEVSATYFLHYFSDPFAPMESSNLIPYTTKYKKLKLEIDFSEFVGVVFASNDQDDFSAKFRDMEYKRYTQVTFDYNLEVLQMDNASSLVFDAGPAMNEAFPTPVGIMLPQAKLNVKWMWVPHEFICDDPITYGKVVYNELIQSMLGHVNEYEFMGFPPGTLLFTSFKTEPIVIPVSDKESQSIVMKLAWNINFEFSFLNTEAEDWYSWADDWAIRGHNTFPYRGDGKFYPASIRGEGDGIPGNHLYPPADFSLIFQTTRT
jgi:hypothetical protein